ncbi:hypothetical protein [Mucilaginibacter sp. OK283]|uniref:hypothetical protein n=1 Tax=Mucilaginibacter sp. OK283 TaxID=1881049 RepID=UPI0015A4F886|nr:hypothetical protein [Mucilaginibacter sp. OK283]
MRPLSVTLDAANMHLPGTGVWVWAVFWRGLSGKIHQGLSEKKGAKVWGLVLLGY